MRKLASAYMDQGRSEEAIAMLETVYRNSEKRKSAALQSVQCELGWAYCLQNRHLEGIALLENAYRAQSEMLGEEHPNTLKITRRLACSYLLDGGGADGMTLLEETCWKQESQMGLEDEETILSMRYLAGAYQYQGRSDDAGAIKVAEILQGRGLLPISWLDARI